MVSWKARTGFIPGRVPEAMLLMKYGAVSKASEKLKGEVRSECGISH
jgi:hypothetical protein